MMIALVAAVLPAGFSVFLVWRNYRLKRDIYDFTEKLDAALETMGREKLDTLLFLLEDLTCALEHITSDETQEK